jgi:hypothetical protein
MNRPAIDDRGCAQERSQYRWNGDYKKSCGECRGGEVLGMADDRERIGKMPNKILE